jgi:REP element-mobilizing transposase RayT
MPQSLSAVYVHAVFSTKERRPFLRASTIRNATHSYLGGISDRLECPPVRIGGTEDHVHVLARLGRTISQADWIKELKRASTVWLKDQGREYADFRWQAGYAVFSVSQSNLGQVAEYVDNQEEHHRRQTFQDEVRALLRKHEIDFDERYVWD